MKFRTASKYRHANPKQAKKEEWYVDVSPASDAALITASARALAINWASGSAGTIGFLPLDAAGRRDIAPVLGHGHGGSICAMAFSPFNALSCLSADDKGILRLWTLSSDISTVESDEYAGGHRGKATSVAFHPCVDGVFVSGGSDGSLCLWSAAEDDPSNTIDLGDKAGIDDLCWQPTGKSLVAVVGKDKQLRVVDVRKGDVVSTVPAHVGTKASRVIWLDPLRIATTGFSKMRERQLCLWSVSVDGVVQPTPIKTVSLDTSTGVIDPMYDADAELLFLAGRGDGTVRSFEIQDAAPWVHELTPARSDTPGKGHCLLPKRAVRVMACEVARVFKLQSDAVVPISYIVPRKSKQSFDDVSELFPPTACGWPTLASDDWLGGMDAPPVNLVSMDPARAEETADDASPLPGTAAAPSAAAPAPKRDFKFVRSAAPVAIDRSLTATDGTLAATVMKTADEQARADADAQAAAAVLSAKTLAARKLIRSTHYRHVTGKEDKASLQYDGIRAQASAGFARQIIANATFFGVPLEGSGGSLALIRHADHGRQPLDPSRVECGANLCDFDFSPHDDRLVLCALDNALVRVFRVDETATTERREGLLCAPDAALAVLRGHRAKLATARWHPLASNVIASCSGDGSLRVHDVNKEDDMLHVPDAHPDTVLSQTFNYSGSLLATSCKDKKMRIFDLRAKRAAFVSSKPCHGGAKAFRVVWMGSHDRLFTAGFSKTSERETAVFDMRNLDAWMGRTSVDVSSGVLEPEYDEDTNVVFVAGRGDTTVRMYEPTDTPHFLTQFGGSSPAVGTAALPKTSVDVQKIELRRFVKLTSTGRVITMRFTVPRKRPEFFQDDIFVPTRTAEPVQTAAEWFGGADATPNLRDLCPRGMLRLSLAPVVTKAVTSTAHLIKQDKDDEGVEDQLFVRMTARTGITSKEDRIAAEQEGVDEDEWSD